MYIALRVNKSETGVASESQNADLHAAHRAFLTPPCQGVCPLCGGGLQQSGRCRGDGLPLIGLGSVHVSCHKEIPFMMGGK